MVFDVLSLPVQQDRRRCFHFVVRTCDLLLVEMLPTDASYSSTLPMPRVLALSVIGALYGS